MHQERLHIISNPITGKKGGSVLIKISNVKKVFKNGKIEFCALNGVSMNINDGEFLILAGPSGSGKSTLLNLIGGMDDITSGDIFIDDDSLKTISKNKLSEFRRENIGFIFQKFNLIETLTVYENVEFPLILKKVDKQKRKELVKDILVKVGLEEKENSFPKNLSGGQQQRVAIARALIGNPKVILADEPTANLDSKNGLECVQMLKKLNKERKITVILSTHDQRIIDNEDNIVYLTDGKINESSQHKNNSFVLSV